MSVADLPSTLGDAERTAIGEFVDFIRGRFGRRVRQLQLFGSRARGEGNEDSDVDILVVIDDLTGGEQREVWHRTGDMLTDHDVILGGLMISTSQWSDLRARERRIVAEIDRDGVSL